MKNIPTFLLLLFYSLFFDLKISFVHVLSVLFDICPFSLWYWFQFFIFL